MANQSYAVPGLVLRPSGQFSQQVQDFQRDLRSLGYIAGPIDGEYGNGTTTAVAALIYDLQNNNGHPLVVGNADDMTVELIAFATL